jgi:hypothetical protein
MIPQIPDSKHLDAKQGEAVAHLAKTKRAIVWWRVGEGKSRIAIFWTYLATKGNPRPVIICSPQAFRTWQDEIDLLGLRTCYKPMFFSYGQLLKRHEFDYNHSTMFNREKERLGYTPNCAIIDELWLYKNPNSKRSEAIQGITASYPSIGLSGSMITANNIEDLFGQAKAVGLARELANSLTSFRSQYTIEVKELYGKFTKRYPKKRAVEAIQSKLASNIHLYFPKERKEIREIPIKLDPTLEQEKLKQMLVRDYYVSTLKEDKLPFELEIKNKVSLLIKLLQISDGFLADGKGGYLSVESNKLSKLIHNISELVNSGERVIVWTAFKRSLQEASELCPFPTVLLSGEHIFDSQAWNRGKAKVAFATIGSGSSINDFANTRYAIIYSSSFSFRALQQAKGRTNRKSTASPILYYYYYQTLGFPDQYVYETLGMSENTEQMTIDITRRIVEDWLTKKAIWSEL